MGNAAGKVLNSVTGVLENIPVFGSALKCVEYLTGYDKMKPKEANWIKKIKKFLPFVSIGLGLASLAYGISEYGPTPSVLIGSAAVAGLTYVAGMFIACARSNKGVLGCALGGVISGVAAVTGLPLEDLANPFQSILGCGSKD